ncbi:hypothetical protein TQ29_06240 [Actibacterium sp. EMB200-NS6]|nr:hypothetical protein TQ29_06240 [Actibacterium sp. EMB200-NS6]
MPRAGKVKPPEARLPRRFAQSANKNTRPRQARRRGGGFDAGRLRGTLFRPCPPAPKICSAAPPLPKGPAA